MFNDDGSIDFYQYPTLSDPKSIRLVELLPGKQSDAIRINLSQSILGQSPAYEALSYRWDITRTFSLGRYEDYNLTGTMDVQSGILCHGKTILIMKNLKIALERLRHKDVPRILWIDGICINQSDNEERSKQVSMMKEIHESAKTVLLWIGEESVRTKNAFRIITKLAAAFHSRADEKANQPSKGPSGHVKIDQGVVNELHAEWEAVADVFTRPYFGRIWIVQEIVLAARARVICGECEIDWRDFYYAGFLIIGMGFVADYDPPTRSNVGDRVRSRWVWDRLMNVGNAWEERTLRSQFYPLATLVSRFLGHGATDPKDRVYGMLGMCGSVSQYGLDNLIQPQYSKSVQEVYQDACEWSLRDSSSSSILNLCDAPATNLIKGLPTWVPDLSKGPQKCKFPELASFDRIKRPLSSLFISQFSFSIENKTLSIKAHIFDTVSLARSPCTVSGKHLVMMEQFLLFSHDPSSYPTGGPKLEAVWRTFLLNLLRTPTSKEKYVPLPAAYGKHFAHAMAREFLNQLGLPTVITGRERPLRDLGSQGSFFSLGALFPEDVARNTPVPALIAKQPFLRLLYESLRAGDGQLWVSQAVQSDVICDGQEGRQFFVTDKGYMGLGPRCPPMQVNGGDAFLPTGSGMRMRDVVAVLAGSDKVWILRSDRAGAYTIVGDSYVYGLSEGICFEANKLPTMETIQLR